MTSGSYPRRIAKLNAPKKRQMRKVEINIFNASNDTLMRRSETVFLTRLSPKELLAVLRNAVNLCYCE